MRTEGGVPMVLTVPLTERIDQAGFFIQMSPASIPGWMEWVIVAHARRRRLGWPAAAAAHARRSARVVPADWRETIAAARASALAPRPRTLRMVKV
jgi:hypothetical protein